MSTSNSFNICPRCGNANTLNAKFCSRCGAQLRVPEEAVVCHKCQTRNSGLANFCRNCGTTLRVGAQTKICPRCNREVDTKDNVCSCGYSFVTLQQTAPQVQSAEKQPVNLVKENKKQSQIDSKQTSRNEVAKPIYRKGGGRAIAFFALIFALLFAWLFFAPAEISLGGKSYTMRLGLEKFDGGVIVGEKGYGFGLVMMLVNIVKQVISGASISTALGSNSISMIVLLAFVALFTICACLHLLICIIRIFSGKRSKRANGLYLLLAILSTLFVALTFVSSFGASLPAFLQKVLSFFDLGGGARCGYVAFAMPLYFWFFYFYSLGAKAKQID